MASWWDYGYQTTAMANRTVMVDNNTWNNTHIATVGRAMALPEKKAWRVFRALDVDYVLVVFGGYLGYPSDDINKFLWMVRIAAGEFPDVKEQHFVGPQGYRVDSTATPAMLESLMYKLCYYGCVPSPVTDVRPPTVLESLMHKLCHTTAVLRVVTRLSLVVLSLGRHLDQLSESEHNSDANLLEPTDPHVSKARGCRYADASEQAFGKRGFDRVRNAQIGQLDIKLRYFEEVFTLSLIHI